MWKCNLDAMMYIMQVKLMLNQKCLTDIYYARTKTTCKISLEYFSVGNVNKIVCF